MGKLRSKVRFDCPWEGHSEDPNFQLTNSKAPNVIGKRCLKCGCLIYIVSEVAMATIENAE